MVRNSVPVPSQKRERSLGTYHNVVQQEFLQCVLCCPLQLASNEFLVSKAPGNNTAPMSLLYTKL
jgi:hypothetical protein